MAHILKVEAEDDEGWTIFVDRRPIINFDKDGKASLPELPLGEHTLTYELRGAGSKLTMDIDPRPRIIVPVGATWPVKAEITAHGTITSDRIYFIVGD